MENIRLIILVSEAGVWHSHKVWNQCKPCHSLQWILPWEKSSLGRASERITDMHSGQNGVTLQMASLLLNKCTNHGQLQGQFLAVAVCPAETTKPMPATATKRLRRCVGTHSWSHTTIWEVKNNKKVLESASLGTHFFSKSRLLI